MPAKIIVLTTKDQLLLQHALDRAIEWERVTGFYRNEGEPVAWLGGRLTPQEVETTARIKDLKGRLS